MSSMEDYFFQDQAENKAFTILALDGRTFVSGQIRIAVDTSKRYLFHKVFSFFFFLNKLRVVLGW